MDRIYFKGSPYPNGHIIEEFIWSGRLVQGKGLIFDFHLVSDSYSSEDVSESEERAKLWWDSKIVWENYHQCTMSSTFWEGNGVLVGTENNQFEFQKLLGQTLIVDSIFEQKEYNYEELAFNIYLLGHDDCAFHKISFTKQLDKSTFDIEWEGKIALSYSGDDEFKYSFESKISSAKFRGISLDKELCINENKELLKKCLIDSDKFELIDDKFEIR